MLKEGKEGLSEARPPVAGSATAVGHRDDFNVITAKDVHQAEGVSRKYVPLRAAAISRPRSGARRDHVDGPP
jgi:hypothetical protein